MQITGTWRVYVAPGFGEEVDWDALPTLRFGGGRIKLDDGSHLTFVTNTRGLRFSMPSGSDDPERRIATLLIDRGSDGFLQGWRMLNDTPVGQFPKGAEAMLDGRCRPVRLVRQDKLAAFREEQQGFAVVRRAMLEEREPSDATPTLH